MFFDVHLVHYIHYLLQNMISDKEKDQIFKEMVFEKGLFYYSDTNKSRIKRAYENLENDFETKEDFIRAVNSLLHSNGLHFYSKLRTISNETEFINYIQSQYNLYNEYTSNNSLNWLNFTKKAIMYGFGILSIENESLKASFMNWYNQTIKSITPEKPKLMESNIFDKIVKELDLIKDVFYSQIENRNDNWNQKDEGRYCNYLYINSNENLFEISKYKNYYTNRIDKSNSALLKNELEEIYKKAFMLYEYSVKELKDHKDKRDVFIGNDGVSQIIESTALFIVRETRINTVFYNCDANDSLFKTFTKDGNTKQCKNETLVNFCVQLLQFIDLTGVLEKVQIDNNKQNPPQQTENSKPDGVLLTNENIDIFKDDFSFTLFTKMYELYKDEKTRLANFSFLFFAMEEEFLVCNQVTFVKFLENEKYNISIEKIDNRQLTWKTSKKVKLYNSIKESLQKRHEKSTN